MSISAVLALVMILSGATGQRPQVDDYLVDVWTTDHGLPQNSVNGIVQTSDRYLWLGTFGGLVRFDGVRFTVVPRVDSAGAHLDRIAAMALARGDTLWLAAESGLIRFANGRFRRWTVADGLPDHSVSSVLATPHAVWITTGAGVYRFRNGAFEFVHATRNAALSRDAEGLVWLGWAEPGSIVFREHSDGTVQPVPRWTGANGYQAQEPGGSRWLVAGNSGSIVLMDTTGRLERSWSRRGGVIRPRIIARGANGEIWVGNEGGIVQLLDPAAPKDAELRTIVSGLPIDASVERMLVDVEGTVWVGTNGNGLIRIKRKLFRVVGDREAAIITSIFEDRGGRMYFGSNCRGLFVRPAGSDSVRRVPTPRNVKLDCVMSIAQGADDALWAGGYAGPLHRSEGGRTAKILDANRKEVGNVLALHVAPDGVMWAGKYNGGLYAFAPDGTPRRHYTTANGLGHNNVTFITTDSAGALWVGTSGGMGRLLDGRFQWTGMADGLPSDQVRVVRPEPDGTVWIGTYGGGLARMRDGKIVAIRQRHGLGDDIVSAIIADATGHFWMSGNRGIYRVARAELDAFADGRADRVHSILYGLADGLLNTETNGGFHPAAWRDREGHVWFPTLRGAAVVDPARASLDGPPPAAVVEAVVVNGDRIETRGILELPSGRPNVEVHYAGLSFLAPDHIAFRYRLSGFDDDTWTHAQTRRVAYYPRLPPGRYRFEVAAANRDGTFGEPAARTLVVRAAFHETWLFRGALLFAGALAAAFAVRQRLAAVRREHEAQLAFSRALLESQEAERRRIAAELHDGLGQDLLLVKNYAALALAGRTQAGAWEHIEHIGAIATGALGSVRTLAHSLTPRQLEHVGVTRALADLVATAGGASDVVFTSAIDDVDDLFDDESRINVFRIVQEAITNILKHAGASRARVEVRHRNGRVEIVVSDDGRGMVPNAGPSAGASFGLDGIHQRAAILGGSFGMRAIPGGGARVIVTLPVPARAPS